MGEESEAKALPDIYSPLSELKIYDAPSFKCQHPCIIQTPQSPPTPR